METKQLIDKFIKGEITEAEFDAESSKLSPEDKAKLDAEAKDKMPSAVEQLKSIRRGTDAVSKKVESENATLATKIQQENLAEAKASFFKEFGIEKAEEQVAFAQDFKTDSINVSNILADMKKHYVAKNPERYLDLEKKQRQSEKEAEEMNARNAGGSAGGGEDPTKQNSKDVQALIEDFRRQGKSLTPEKAQRLLVIMKNSTRSGFKLPNP